MRLALVCAALALALALQTTLSRWVIGRTAAVDLVLVVVVAVALTWGPFHGFLAGTLGGLAQDTLSGGIIGVGGLAKTVAGFVVGIAGSQLIVARSGQRLVTFFLATLLHAVCFFGLYAMLPGTEGLGVPYRAILGQAVGNSVVGLLVFQVAELVPAVAERRRLGRSRWARRRW